MATQTLEVIHCLVNDMSEAVNGVQCKLGLILALP